jgi:tRNA-dihydrouridine synthase
MPGRIAAYLLTGNDPGDPALAEQGAIAVRHLDAMLAHEGEQVGLRNARKHISWYLTRNCRAPDEAKSWRRRLCTSENAREVRMGLASFFAQAREAA